MSPPGWEGWQSKGFSGSYTAPASAVEVRARDVRSPYHVYCQAPGKDHRDAGHANYWWLLTGNESGDRLAWVSAARATGGGDNEPVPGVPGCPEA